MYLAKGASNYMPYLSMTYIGINREGYDMRDTWNRHL